MHCSHLRQTGGSSSRILASCRHGFLHSFFGYSKLMITVSYKNTNSSELTKSSLRFSLSFFLKYSFWVLFSQTVAYCTRLVSQLSGISKLTTKSSLWFTLMPSQAFHIFSAVWVIWWDEHKQKWESYSQKKVIIRSDDRYMVSTSELVDWSKTWTHIPLIKKSKIEIQLQYTVIQPGP